MPPTAAPAPRCCVFSSVSRRRRTKSAAWYARQNADSYVRQARHAGYRSRAAYKLLEIDAAAALFAPGMRVADLGAAPGGWAQVIADRVGDKGRVVAVDLLPMQPLRGVFVIQGDFLAAETRSAIAAELGGDADVVISDMSPNISGVAISDQMRALALGEAALAFAAEHLRPGGALLLKIFEGEEREELRQAVKDVFATTRLLRPAATRAKSRELYLLAADFAGRKI